MGTSRCSDTARWTTNFYKIWINIYVRVYPSNIQLKNVDEMISNDSPSSDQNTNPKTLKGETNNHNIDLNQESF